MHSPHIVIDIDYPTLTILEQNDAHVSIALKGGDDVVGKPFLEAFPDTSEKYLRTGTSDVVESIHRVITTGKPDVMPDVKYDLKDKDGNWVEKYWSATHYPIFDGGKLVAVYQDTKDITEERLLGLERDRTVSQLEQILSTSLVGTWHWNIKRNYVIADDNLAELFGVDKDQAKDGLPLERFVATIHPDDRQRIQTSINDAVDKKKTYQEEYRTIDAEGRVKWVIARGVVDYDEDKTPSVFSGTIIDITDRKRAEKSVVESEQRLTFMADSMPQLVWITRPDGYHEWYNKQWYDYTGTKEGTTDGEGWNDLFHPDDQARAHKLWRHSLKTGDSYEIEYRLYHAPTQRYRWVIGRALPFRNSAGTIVKWYGTCTDVDEQKHTSEVQAFLADISKELTTTLDTRKLLSAVAKLSVPVVADWCSIDLLNSDRSGFTQVALVHRDKEKREQAKAYRELHPYTVDQDISVPRVVRTGITEHMPVIDDALIEKHVTNDDAKKLLSLIHVTSMVIVPLRVGEEVIGAMSFVSSDSGRQFDDRDVELMEDIAARVSLALTNSWMYDESQEDLKHRRKLEHDLLIEKQKLESRVKERTQQLQLTNEGLRDEINKRHKAEKEITDFSKELRRSNEELENFAYVASHDLQEPLRKIQAFSDLLISEHAATLGSDGADYLERMQAAAGRMSVLIEDLLTFSRVSSRQSPPKDVDLGEVVQGVLNDLETRIEETHATVTIAKLPTICADPTQMRQLFQNLIGNALKFHKTDIPPVVTVTSRKKRGGYEIKVSDNGIGFDEKYLERIFSVFQRLNTRSAYEGTGIGLAVCRKIIERYNGTITAESRKGDGSTFIIWLPLKGGTHGTTK